MSTSLLHIPKTVESPLVEFQEKRSIMKIEGRSLLENPFDFYQRLIEWIEGFVLNSNEKLTFEIYLDYFNSSSGRYLLEFLIKANKEYDRFNILWICDEHDEIMIEKGMEFRYLLKIPLKIKVI